MCGRRFTSIFDTMGEQEFVAYSGTKESILK
jgi:hypothetical protein